MRVLMDTHAQLWAVDEPARLGVEARSVLQNAEHELLLSAATIWEIAIKVGLKKLALSLPYRQWIDQVITDLGMSVLPITTAYADAQIGLATSITAILSTGYWWPKRAWKACQSCRPTQFWSPMA